MSSFSRIHGLRASAFALTIATTATLSASLSACAGSDESGRQPLGAAASPSAVAATSSSAAPSSGANASGPQLPPAAASALDAGNAAYRAKKYDEALASYRAATVAAPDHAAPWFGLYMVANELKNSALADSAMRRVKALSADPATLTAHAEVSADAANKSSAMPQGHPKAQLLPPPSSPQVPPGHPSTQAIPPGHPTFAKPTVPKAAVTPTKSGRAP